MISQDLTLSIAKKGVTNSNTERIASVRDLCVYHNGIMEYMSGIDKNDNKQKTLIPALYTYNCDGKRTYDNFTNSNVVIIDLDDKPQNGFNYEYTSMLFENPEYFGRFVMNSILFVQKSFNGASHIAVKIPMAKTIDQYRKYAEGAVRVFRNKFKEEFGVWIPEDEKVLDVHSNKCTQACFLSPYQIINCDDVNTVALSDEDMIDMDSVFGYKKSKDVYDRDDLCSKEQTQSVASAVNNVNLNKEEVRDDSYKTIQDSSLKFGVSVNIIPPLPNEYNPKFEGNSNINNFVKDTDNVIETKLVIGKQHLNYNITTEQLECIKNNVIRNFDNVTNGRLLLNMNGMFEGIVDVKMKFFFKRNDKNEIVKLEQGQHRRLHLKRYIKQTILNGIAKCNYDITYDKYIISDIIYTIKWLLNNSIEVKGKTRNIDSNIVKECIADVCDNWDSFYVEYDTNRYICKPVEKITSFKELMKHWQYLKQKRYAAIDNTFMYFYETLKLQGKKYSDIAQVMNDNNIEAKTDKGWTYESVRAYVSKISNVSDYSVIIEEMIRQGEKYADIAKKLNEEGYTTKQGKEFNAKSIENYVKRKLKK